MNTQEMDALDYHVRDWEIPDVVDWSRPDHKARYAMKEDPNGKWLLDTETNQFQFNGLPNTSYQPVIDSDGEEMALNFEDGRETLVESTRPSKRKAESGNHQVEKRVRVHDTME